MSATAAIRAARHPISALLLNGRCEMEMATGARSRRPFLRGLDAPVRDLPDALEEITRGLLTEFIDPATLPQDQKKIIGRLALVRRVAGERNYATLAGRIRVCLLTFMRPELTV
jgi:hypothetical protein